MSRATSRRAWLAAIAASPALDHMRSDRRANILLAARILGWTATPSMTTRPTRAATAARMGVTERTVSRLWRWLEHAGWLHCTEPGSTAAFRPAWARDRGNLAREWVLTMPAGVPRDGELPAALESRKKSRDFFSAKVSPRPGSVDRRFSYTPTARFPQTPQPKKLTEKGWAAEARRYLAAGWLPRDVEHARDHSPGGHPWRFDDPPRYPRSLMRFRLSRWLGPDGRPLPPPSQLRTAAHVAVLGEQAARRAEREARPAVDVAAHAARARAMLAEALGRPVT